jgi:hypothetical protein
MKNKKIGILFSLNIHIHEKLFFFLKKYVLDSYIIIHEIITNIIIKKTLILF